VVRKEIGVKMMVTMPKTMAERVDRIASDMGISRSAAINVLVSQGLQANDGITAIKDLMTAYEAEKAKETAPAIQGE
jgi:metal-responsive CopG/Arc/MetJ family transcriptional regulator